MGQDIPLGRVAGIRVGANWTVAVILVLIAWLLAGSVLPGVARHMSVAVYWTVGGAAAALFLASLLAHELSHALVARHNGLKVRAITLWMLGGITELEGEPPDAGADLRIAVAGPAVSVAAAGVFLGMAQAVGYAGGPAVVTAGLVWLAVMNGMLAVFNMLPGAPLDGGRVLRALLWRHYGDRRRAEVAAARAWAVPRRGDHRPGRGGAAAMGRLGRSVADADRVVPEQYAARAKTGPLPASASATCAPPKSGRPILLSHRAGSQTQDFIDHVAARSAGRTPSPLWTGAVPLPASWSSACSPGFPPHEGGCGSTGWRSGSRSPPGSATEARLWPKRRRRRGGPAAFVPCFAGEDLRVLGANGAGKTTTVRMLCALARPTGGHAARGPGHRHRVRPDLTPRGGHGRRAQGQADSKAGVRVLHAGSSGRPQASRQAT